MHLALITVESVQWDDPGTDRLHYSQVLRRLVDGEWDCPSFGTGASWPWPTLHRPEDFGTRQAQVVTSGYHSDNGWVVGEIAGVAGTAATTLRVTQAERTIERPVDPDVGWWVAAWDGTREARVELLDHEGVVLLEQTFGAKEPF